MNTQITELIVRAAEYPMSATAIAKRIGKSKAAQIADEIASLVADGSLTVDNSGMYPLYKAVHKNTVSKTTSTTVVTDALTVNNVNNDGIPEGYTVSRPGKRKSDGKVGRKITIPSGQSFFVENGDTLVNINNGDCVKTITSRDGNAPEAQLSQLITDYTHDHNMTAYTIGHKYGSIGRDNTTGILDYKISKINKAAK